MERTRVTLPFGTPVLSLAPVTTSHSGLSQTQLCSKHLSDRPLSPCLGHELSLLWMDQDNPMTFVSVLMQT